MQDTTSTNLSEYPSSVLNLHAYKVTMHRMRSATQTPGLFVDAYKGRSQWESWDNMLIRPIYVQTWRHNFDSISRSDLEAIRKPSFIISSLEVLEILRLFLPKSPSLDVPACVSFLSLVVVEISEIGVSLRTTGVLGQVPRISRVYSCMVNVKQSAKRFTFLEELNIIALCIPDSLCFSRCGRIYF